MVIVCFKQTQTILNQIFIWLRYLGQVKKGLVNVPSLFIFGLSININAKFRNYNDNNKTKLHKVFYSKNQNQGSAAILLVACSNHIRRLILFNGKEWQNLWRQTEQRKQLTASLVEKLFFSPITVVVYFRQAQTILN